MLVRMSDGKVGFERRILGGSERAAVAGAQPAGTLDLEQEIDITVVLRRRAGSPPVGQGARLNREQLTENYGADPADVSRARDVLTNLGLHVVDTDLASRRLRVSGTIRQLCDVFGTTLERVESPRPDTGEPVVHRHRTGPLSIPAELDGAVVAVLGLDDRPQARAHLRRAPATAVTTSYTPIELGRVYKFPPGTAGAGQTLAIVELGGGFDAADLDAYFAGLGIATPMVSAVGVDGATNVPGKDPNGADGEVLLDIEVAAALAPKANVIVYFAPNTDAGFVDAIATAARSDPTPTALSISWGESEDEWTPQARTALDDAINDAVALGITVTAAAGDSGSSDQDGSAAHVDFPASSPHALACGGTTLRADTSTDKIDAETVWNDGISGGATGGGVSDIFKLPTWQANAGVPMRGDARSGGRGVPDVAGDADPRTGYQVRVDGKPEVIGGTSAVAPLWAALVCRLAQAAGGPLGLLQPLLYAGIKPGVGSNGFRDIVAGSNGAYHATAGWDPCTGLGSPDGEALLTVVRPTKSRA